MGPFAVCTSTRPDPYLISYYGRLELLGSLHDLYDHAGLFDRWGFYQQLVSLQMDPLRRHFSSRTYCEGAQ